MVSQYNNENEVKQLRYRYVRTHQKLRGYSQKRKNKKKKKKKKKIAIPTRLTVLRWPLWVSVPEARCSVETVEQSTDRIYSLLGLCAQ